MIETVDRKRYDLPLDLEAVRGENTHLTRKLNPDIEYIKKWGVGIWLLTLTRRCLAFNSLSNLLRFLSAIFDTDK